MKQRKPELDARPFIKKSNNEILEDMIDQKSMENNLSESDSELSKRVKGVNYFYNFSKLIASDTFTLRKFYQGVVDLIPSAWQYPEITCAKLIIDDHEFSTKNYLESEWQQKGEIIVNSSKVGFLIVGYLVEKPEANEGPFLNEERYLLNLVCERVSRITEHKQTKSMLQESDEKYRTLMDEVNDGIYICDLNGMFIYANRALACILGFEQPAAIIGKNFLEFLPTEKGDELSEQNRTAMSNGIQPTLIKTEIIKQDGKSAFIEIKPTTFVTGGKFMGTQGVVRDTTKDRKQEEEKRKHLATHDSLTGLYHRTFFDAEMKRVERERQFPISIVRIDVANLRNENDVIDQQAREKILNRVAEVLMRSYRGDDIIARIGEIEFAILLPNVDENMADITIKRIQVNLQNTNNTESEPVLKFFIGASTAVEGMGLDSVLEKAEVIMCLEKKNN